MCDLICGIINYCASNEIQPVNGSGLNYSSMGTHGDMISISGDKSITGTGNKQHGSFFFSQTLSTCSKNW